MNIYLNSMQLSLFFRSKFMDVRTTFEGILDKIDREYWGSINNLLPFPLPNMPDELPLYNSSSIDGTYFFQIYQNRFDAILRKNCCGKESIAFQNIFFDIIHKIINSIDVENDLCTRIGIVETSFCYASCPVDVIASSFFSDLKYRKKKDIGVVYLDTKKISIGTMKMEINKHISISTGNLPLPNVTDGAGVVIRKDVNNAPVQKMLLKMLDKVVNYSKEEMGEQKVLETLNVNKK